MFEGITVTDIVIFIVGLLIGTAVSYFVGKAVFKKLFEEQMNSITLESTTYFEALPPRLCHRRRPLGTWDSPAPVRGLAHSTDLPSPKNLWFRQPHPWLHLRRNRHSNRHYHRIRFRCRNNRFHPSKDEPTDVIPLYGGLC